MNGYTGIDNLEIMAEAVNYNRFLSMLIRKQITPGMRVLDIGAGIGTFAKMLHEEGYKVTCFEPDAKQAEHIRSIGLDSVQALETLAPASFDFIYSLNVLEHIEDDKVAFVQWLRLLVPDGRLLIYVPAFQLLYSSMDKKVGHFRRYTKRGLSEMANGTGGHVVVSRYVDSFGFLASLLYKYGNDGTGSLNRYVLNIYDKFVFPVSRIIDVVTGGLIGKNVYIIAGRKNG